jgi:hypothetical protein
VGKKNDFYRNVIIAFLSLPKVSSHFLYNFRAMNLTCDIFVKINAGIGQPVKAKSSHLSALMCLVTFPEMNFSAE